MAGLENLRSSALSGGLSCKYKIVQKLNVVNRQWKEKGPIVREGPSLRSVRKTMNKISMTIPNRTN